MDRLLLAFGLALAIASPTFAKEPPHEWAIRFEDKTAYLHVPDAFPIHQVHAIARALESAEISDVRVGGGTQTEPGGWLRVVTEGKLARIDLYPATPYSHLVTTASILERLGVEEILLGNQKPGASEAISRSENLPQEK